MKVFYTLFLSLIISASLAQTQIPEGGFNNWTPDVLNIYYEPAGEWWTTLNPLALLGCPVTVSYTSDAHSGEYAARLETQQWGTFMISGLLAAGGFIMQEPYIVNGRPFTDSPDKFKGWYKYMPVEGDSAGIGTILTRYNTGTGQKDTIASAVMAVTETVDTYTEFEIEFEYLMPDVDPDTIIIVFTSSGDGQNISGGVGSVLYLDDIALEYTSGVQESLFPEFTVKAYPSPATDQLNFTFNTQNAEKLECKVYSLDGQLIEVFTPSGNEYQLDVSGWPQGNYIIQVTNNNTQVSSTKFIIAH